MSSILFRVGRFSFRHKWWVLAAWVAALAVVLSLVGALSPKFSQDFDLPGTDGGIAMEQMTEEFPELAAKPDEPAPEAEEPARDPRSDEGWY